MTQSKLMQAYLGHVQPHHGGGGLYDVRGRLPLDGITVTSWGEAVDLVRDWLLDNDLRWRAAPEIDGLVYGQQGATVYIYPYGDEEAGTYYDLYLDAAAEE